MRRRPTFRPGAGVDDISRTVVVRLVVAIAILLLAGQIAILFLSARSFEQTLIPEVEGKARISGELAAAQISRAVELGIPLGSLVGMEAFLDGWIEGNPSLAHLRVATLSGAVLYADTSGLATDVPDNSAMQELTVPVLAHGELVANVLVGMKGSEAPSVLLDLRFEVATVLFVSLLIGIEFLLVFGLARLSAPMRFVRQSLEAAGKGDFTRFMGIRGQNEIGRIVASYNASVRRLNGEFGEFAREAEEVRAEQLDRSVRTRILEAVERVRGTLKFVDVGMEQVREFRSPFDVRIAFFFFMVSQELSRPFLPLVFDRIYEPVEGLSRELFIGLPISGFMLAVLIVTPLAGAMTERISPRSLFLAGVFPSAIGFIGTALSTDMFAALTFWVVSGFGYGVIFITSQVYVAENTDPAHRAAGMAIFSGAAFAAFVCGPAIGGILADRLGYLNTLIASGGLAVISGAIAFVSLDPEPLDNKSGEHAGGIPGFGKVAALLLNRRFFSITFFSALPAKVALAGVFFYLVPIYLYELGSTQSATGRIMMVYGIACVIVTPLAARFSDVTKRADLFIAAGGLIGAAGCIIPAVQESSALVLAGVGVLGLGHALLTAPQLASVQEIAEEVGPEVGMGVGTIIGVFRTFERIGTALGAVVVAALAAAYGFSVALAAVGAGALILGILYVVTEILPRARRAAS